MTKKTVTYTGPDVQEMPGPMYEVGDWVRIVAEHPINKTTGRPFNWNDSMVRYIGTEGFIEKVFEATGHWPSYLGHQYKVDTNENLWFEGSLILAVQKKPEPKEQAKESEGDRLMRFFFGKP